MYLKNDIWFAWFPVRVGGANWHYRGRWTWLKRVRRVDFRVPIWGSVRTSEGFAAANIFHPTVARMYVNLYKDEYC